jgi:hypothetical protein
MMGFPEGELYKGTLEQDQKLESQFLRKCKYNLEHKVPVWNGEFATHPQTPLLLPRRTSAGITFFGGRCRSTSSTRSRDHSGHTRIPG